MGVDKLTLQRTQPVQGHQVYVDVLWNGDKVGELDLPFTGWIKFNRLLQKGIELDARENKALNISVKVEGQDAVRFDIPVPATNRAKREGERINELRQGVVGDAKEIAKVEEDPELQADLRAVLQAERTQEASSLREDNDGE